VRDCAVSLDLSLCDRATASQVWLILPFSLIIFNFTLSLLSWCLNPLQSQLVNLPMTTNSLKCCQMAYISQSLKLFKKLTLMPTLLKTAMSSVKEVRGTLSTLRLFSTWISLGVVSQRKQLRLPWWMCDSWDLLSSPLKRASMVWVISTLEYQSSLIWRSPLGRMSWIMMELWCLHHQWTLSSARMSTWPWDSLT